MGTGIAYPQGHLGGVMGGREEEGRSREEVGKDERGRGISMPVGDFCKISG